jgi:hypothetical protein
VGTLHALLTAAATTRSRMRFLRGLGVVAKWLPGAVLFLTPVAISYRYELISGHVLGSVVGLCAAGLGVLVVRSVSEGPNLLEATLRLDASHQLKGRLAAALEFSGAFRQGGAHIRETDADQEGYVSVILKDAERLGELSPVQAAPLLLPKPLVWGALMLLAWTSLFVVPDRKTVQPPLKVAAAEPSQPEQWIAQDDAELLRADSEDLLSKVESDEAKSVAERYNEIVLKAVSGEIDQAEAFRLAAELEADLVAAGKESSDFAEGLEKRGAALEKREATRQLGQALVERRYKEAEEALRKLAERLASDKQAPSQKELEDLRASLEEMRGEVEEQKKASAAESEAREKEERALSERQKSLLEKKRNGTLSDAEKQELDRNERQLKRLSREKKREQDAAKTLSELDKQLAEAARELQEERKKSGQFMEQAARTLSEGAAKELTEEEKQELIKQLKALKERLRRQNQDGQQAERLRQFQERARGQQGRPGQVPGGEQEGKPGAGSARLTPGGTPMPMPGQGPGQGQGEKGGQEGNDPGGGKEPGQAHDPNLTGASSRLDGKTGEDTAAVAQDTGQGQSASETILSVAEEGFVSSSYEALYREYQTVAEEVMDKDAVPVGRKAHILRYFELIRPRGGGSKAQGEP